MIDIARTRRSTILACAVLTALAAPAAADDAELTGFVTYGAGELSGTVTSSDGKPLAGADVYIVPATGAPQQVVTGKDGRYRATIRAGAAYTTVFVKGHVRIGGEISVPTMTAYGEAIEIHDTLPPAVMPKLVSKPWVIPAYSEQAKDKNAWAKAWLMLDIDERGTVTRLQLLRKPGLELDKAAIAEGWKLQFEPARDRVGRAVRTMVLWSFEWPAYWWMLEHKYRINQLPGEVAKVPCRGQGGTSAYFRDCSTPDLSKGFLEAWIDRPRP